MWGERAQAILVAMPLQVRPRKPMAKSPGNSCLGPSAIAPVLRVPATAPAAARSRGRCPALANDHGSLWLHEAFTTYMESLYLERLYGKDAALRYLQSQRKLIKNEEPIAGPSDVRYARSPDADMYYKGAWMLHSLRYALNDDALFFKALRQFYDDFKYDHTAARWDFFATFRAVTGKDYYAPCVQYLDHPRIPVFVYSIVKKGGKLCLRYTYEANAYNFDLPISVGNATAPTRIQPTTAGTRGAGRLTNARSPCRCSC